MEKVTFTSGTYIFILSEIIGIIAIVALIWAVWRKKTREPFFPAFIGACVWFIFSMVLEALPKSIVLSLPAVSSSVLLTAVVASVFAGVFEETGRFIAFKTVLRKYDTKRTAVTYGIGHGGAEAVLLIAVNLMGTFMVGYFLSSGMLDASLSKMPPEYIEQMNGRLQSLVRADISDILIAYIERLTAIAIHISLSVPVFLAAREKRSLWLLPLAVFLHFAVDAVYAYLSFSGCNIAVTEAVTVLVTAAMAVFAYRLYRSRPDEVIE